MSEWPSKWNIQKNNQDQNFTFAEFYKLNITSEQLYLWSAPMNVVERYQFYLNLLLTSNTLSSSMATHTCSIIVRHPNLAHCVNIHWMLTSLIIQR
ncbi:unnamed protein product [Rotaria sp. Silwood1]|nr:unnamed protein product [Rotaria sp. Silwood1]CAF0836702.1 unnamed protein product [Rotaria sp. Silwood1]CAF3363017.1 unnamed protein product [Rotaria sp. Silwood1]CAF3403187.1 unnamed protein product [Rotaria sp. Silwood1]CAF4585099.1 unnamed protein product [Rotaria sp. Silwood1]